MVPDPLIAAARGLAVFAVHPGAKTIARPGWQHAATADPETLRRTWRPGDNIGIGCWRSGVVGIDVDVRADRDGRRVLAELADRHGEGLPSTLTIGTPSGGTHLYFRPPAGAAIGSWSGARSPLGLGVDVRGPGRGGRGGYLVGPGSVVDGRTYVIERDDPIAELPAWLTTLLTQGGTPLRRLHPR
jgi:hypothetical protein